MHEHRLSKLLVLGFCFHLTALAVPADPSNVDQASIGFDPNSYVYFEGDHIPKDGPGPAPYAPLDPFYIPTTLPRLPNNIRGPPEENNTHIRKPEDFPIWLQRSRPVRAIPGWPPRQTRERFVAEIKTFWYNISNTDRPITWGIDIRRDAWVLRLGWVNPENETFPAGLQIGSDLVSPGELLVRRERNSKETPKIMAVDWAPSRLLAANSQYPNGLGGQVLLSEGHFGFGYRLFHEVEISPMHGQSPNPLSNIDDLFREATKTSFDSPILPIRQPETPSPVPDIDDRGIKIYDDKAFVRVGAVLVGILAAAIYTILMGFIVC